MKNNLDMMLYFALALGSFGGGGGSVPVTEKEASTSPSGEGVLNFSSDDARFFFLGSLDMMVLLQSRILTSSKLASCAA